MVRCAWRARAVLGECPSWNTARQRLEFVDLARGELLAYCPAKGTGTRIRLATDLGFLASDDNGHRLCGSGLEVWSLHESDAPLQRVATVPGDPRQLRLNDAALDRNGILWTGTMDRRGMSPIGGIFQCHGDGRVAQWDDGYIIPNGFAISRGHDRIYIADSPRGIVYSYDLNYAGVTQGKRVWLQIEAGQGAPDGMAMDCEDHLWIALHGGGCVRRYRPDATLVREIRLPARNVTACAFGGEGRDALYVTTAEDRSATTRWQRLWRTRGGHLYVLDPGVRG